MDGGEGGRGMGMGIDGVGLAMEGRGVGREVGREGGWLLLYQTRQCK